MCFSGNPRGKTFIKAYVTTGWSKSLCAPDDYNTKKNTKKYSTLNSFNHLPWCLWYSWTTCLRTESFLKPFDLQDLRIFLRPIFFSGVRCKTQCIRTIRTQLMSWRLTSQNIFGIWTVLYWTRSSRTQFGVSINVWRLAGDTLNITCNFLYCNHQVHRDFLITLYN